MIRVDFPVETHFVIGKKKFSGLRKQPEAIMNKDSTQIEKFGECSIPSPANYEFYTRDDALVSYKAVFHAGEEVDPSGMTFFEQGGPREKIYFDPKATRAGIVTCGGLCPGINDVIRGIVMELHYRYGVKSVLGFRYGYQGMVKRHGHEPVNLTPDLVKDLMQYGGSFLSSSRGNQDPAEMVDYLEELGINILFAIGGDGTLRGAQKISEEIKRRGKEISVIGIPKTIDNDINYIEKTFGFSTAFAEAVRAVNSAHVEAVGAPNGIGLVKLMGRHSGFIAANAVMASRHVNFVLIPENDFDLYGPGGFLETLKSRMVNRHHAVIIVAEGAGQKFFEGDGATDKSGNKKLKDIGLYLKEVIVSYLKDEGLEVNLKYIDPSYQIRSVPANPEDAVFCNFLAQNAVHAAMSGRTNMVVGLWQNMFTHLPIELAVEERKVLNTGSDRLWRSVLSTTGQPAHMLCNSDCGE